MITITTQGQSLMDVAVQNYAGPEGIFRITNDNTALIPNLAVNPYSGSKLNVDDSVGEGFDKETANYMREGNIRVNTKVIPAGIGGMSISPAVNQQINQLQIP